jgi:ferredoxin-NADP reductase
MTITERILGSRTLAALTQPHGVDRYLELVNPMWAAKEVRGRVVDVVRETDGEHPVATLTIEPTSTWRGHRAGQYVQVGVEIPGARRTTRCFSISSAASAPGETFTLTVRAHEEGLVSKFLVREAQPGLVVHLSQAEGDFTLTESPATPTNNHLLMLSGGSGITPVMSQLRTLLRDGYDGKAGRKVTFVHWARSEADQIFAEELQRIRWADNGVDVHTIYGEHFSAEALARIVPAYRDTDTWACGPGPMMELVHAAYDESPRLRTEYFKLGANTATAGSAEGDVVFSRAGESAPNSGASLLEQAEALGLTPEYGCRMGICFSCVSRKQEGTVRNVLTGEESSLPDEEIRICVSAPVGDCTVDL